MSGFNWDQVPVTELTPANPTPTSDFSAISAGAGEEIMVLGLRITLAADATVATRELTLRIDNSAGNPVYRMGGIDATASQSKAMNVAPGLPYQATPTNGDELIAPLPNPCIIPKGGRVRVEVSGTQAGDVITVKAFVKVRPYLKT